MTAPIRWLHISDFHWGKEGSHYSQLAMFEYILGEVEKRIKEGQNLDLIFITGDLANNGHKQQYEDFYDKFYFPLSEKLGKNWQGEIFTVPGNHDANWDEAKAVKKHGVLNDLPNFLNPDSDGLKLREPLIPRFSAYSDHDFGSQQKGWIESEGGTYTEVFDIRDISIGIVGLNTGWLSENNEKNEKNKDRRELTPGYNLLREAIKQIKEKQLRIVLGHHPLNWLRDEDERAIKALLANTRAIYLHGHLHQAGELYEYGAGKNFLSLCTGAAFKVRPEDQIKKNGILFCEYFPENHCIQAEPLIWHNEQGWIIDSSAFHKNFRMEDEWKYELTVPTESAFNGQIKDIAGSGFAASPAVPKPPPGWLIVDYNFLETKRQSPPLDPDAVLHFFDGRYPAWEHALSSSIPKRKRVSELVEDFIKIQGSKETHLCLIKGAGGEGKSTILRQTICDLVDTGGWQVLWQEQSGVGLPQDIGTHLPKSDRFWIIAADDAEMIVENLMKTVQYLSKANRYDVHFLLCARDTDWKAHRGNKYPWHNYCRFEEKLVRGLNGDDAAAIINAWSAYGDRGLGKLTGRDINAAIEDFLEKAKSELYPEDGTFLGAMLQVRYGEKLHARIQQLLFKLQERQYSYGTLLDAFAYIVALHSENQQILDRRVLAHTLGIKPGKIMSEVLGPLGDEAALVPSAQIILTRHRAIANEARKILEKDYDLNFDILFEEIVRAAVTLRRQGEEVFMLPLYEDLPKYFFGTDRKELGISLSEIIMQNTNNARVMTRLCHFLRKYDYPEIAVKLFRNMPVYIKRDRGFYNEWSTTEGAAGNHGIAVWLSALSLSDGIEMSPPNNDQAKISLAGLGKALSELYTKYNDTDFLEASGICGQLGLKLRLDTTTEGYFKKYREAMLQAGIQECNDVIALGKLINGITKAWEIREDNLPDYVLVPDFLHFEGLSYLMKIISKKPVDKAKIVSLPEKN